MHFFFFLLNILCILLYIFKCIHAYAWGYKLVEIECPPQLTIEYKIKFQDYKFLICFYFLSNELSNKSFVILFYILGC